MKFKWQKVQYPIEDKLEKLIATLVVKCKKMKIPKKKDDKMFVIWNEIIWLTFVLSLIWLIKIN